MLFTPSIDIKYIEQVPPTLGRKNTQIIALIVLFCYVQSNFKI